MAQGALADFDPQQSRLDWLAGPPAGRVPVIGVKGFRDGLRTRARLRRRHHRCARAHHGPDLSELLPPLRYHPRAVLPSTIDIRRRSDFSASSSGRAKIENKLGACVAVVANRVKENTLISKSSTIFWRDQGSLSRPLREAQNYVRAYTRGEHLQLPEYLAWPDWKQWKPITEWLGAAQPAGHANKAAEAPRHNRWRRTQLSTPIPTNRFSKRRCAPASTCRNSCKGAIAPPAVRASWSGRIHYPAGRPPGS